MSESPWFTDRLHPNHWYNRASDLRAAAGGVWLSMSGEARTKVVADLGLYPGFDMSLACRPAYHMLCGLALEVILKAVLVNRGDTFSMNKHQLNPLADRVGFKRTKTERQLFDYYSDCITWSGRYPTPKEPTEAKLVAFYAKANDVLTEQAPLRPGSMIKLSRWADADRWEVFHDIWKRIASLYEHR